MASGEYLKPSESPPLSYTASVRSIGKTSTLVLGRYGFLPGKRLMDMDVWGFIRNILSLELCAVLFPRMYLSWGFIKVNKVSICTHDWNCCRVYCRRIVYYWIRQTVLNIRYRNSKSVYCLHEYSNMTCDRFLTSKLMNDLTWTFVHIFQNYERNHECNDQPRVRNIWKFYPDIVYIWSTNNMFVWHSGKHFIFPCVRFSELSE